jgi:hypothetical protein
MKMIQKLIARLTSRQKTIGMLVIAGVLLFLLTLPRHPGPTIPASEVAFMTVATQAHNAWVDAPNDLARIGMRQARAGALCRALPDLVVVGWNGWIAQIEPNQLPDFSGKYTARIVIALSNHITLSTPASPIFNMPDTLVEAGSPVYDEASTLRIGQRVNFSAHFMPSANDCMAEESFTSDGSMRNPDFKIILTDLVADGR